MTTKTNKEHSHQASSSLLKERTEARKKEALVFISSIQMTERELDALQARFPETPKRALVWRALIDWSPDIFMPPKEEKQPVFRFEDLPQA